MTDDDSGRRQPQQVHDPRILRAIAHPVRARILDELGATGPMRAADIAQTLGIPANQASFHLRQLAKYGLVVEAPEEARDGRDRVWKVVHEAGLNIDTHELAEAPGGKAAVQVFRRVWSDSAHDAVDRAEKAERRPDTRVMVSDVAVRLTREQADEFAEDLNQLADSWRRRGRSAGPEALTYQLLLILQPAREV
jgi:predicted ArsR family transcriptional regulator